MNNLAEFVEVGVGVLGLLCAYFFGTTRGKKCVALFGAHTSLSAWGSADRVHTSERLTRAVSSRTCVMVLILERSSPAATPSVKSFATCLAVCT